MDSVHCTGASSVIPKLPPVLYFCRCIDPLTAASVPLESEEYVQYLSG